MGRVADIRGTEGEIFRGAGVNITSSSTTALHLIKAFSHSHCRVIYFPPRRREMERGAGEGERKSGGGGSRIRL